MARTDLCCICRIPVRITNVHGTVITNQEADWCNYYRLIYSYRLITSNSQVSDTFYCPNGCELLFDLSPKCGSYPERRCYLPRATTSGSLLASSCCTASTSFHVRQVHAYCWEILERTVGTSMMKDNLDLLLRALPVTLDYQPFGPTGMFVRQPFSFRNRREWVGDIIFTSSKREYRRKIPERHVYTPLSDPSNIPALKELIEHSVDEKDKSSESTDRDARYLPLTRHRGIAKLPAELQIMVLDYLREPLDVYNAVAAFGWQVPDTYGRSQVSSELIPELNDIPSGKINWVTLFTGLGRFLRNPPLGFANRRRIFEIVHDVHHHFLYS